ncbi:MAG: hypothetical protein QOH24_835 [Verrucomicrobiota bacterium]|jgi:hypothetical protein
MRISRFLVLGSATVFAAFGAIAQSPPPTGSAAPLIVVPAADSALPVSAATTQKTPGEPDLTAEIELLKQLKAKNDETLKKQQATLEALDQLQKDADQIRIFSKRG